MNHNPATEDKTHYRMAVGFLLPIIGDSLYYILGEKYGEYVYE